jgi:hypothetical protein
MGSFVNWLTIELERSGLFGFLAFLAAAGSLLLGWRLIRSNDRREQEHQRQRNGIGELLAGGLELKRMRVGDETQWRDWQHKYQAWVETCHKLITDALSPAHAVGFLYVSVMAAHVSGSFNEEHGNCIVRLDKYCENLKRMLPA